MKIQHALLTTAASALLAGPAFAGLSASATYTNSLESPGVFQYDLTLTNTGTTTIGTYWFAWIPGAGFLSAKPTDLTSPMGWSETLFNKGHSIQWTSTTSLLQPGQSLSGFSFESRETPALLMGVFKGPGKGAGDPVTTSFVYVAAPLADPGAQFVTRASGTRGTGVPEPATLGLFGLGGAGLIFSGLRRRTRLPARGGAGNAQS